MTYNDDIRFVSIRRNYMELKSILPLYFRKRWAPIYEYMKKKLCWPVEIKYNSTDTIAFHVLGHAFSIGYKLLKGFKNNKK